MKQWKVPIGIVILSCMSFPVIGLLAGVFVGKYKLVCFTLKAMWLVSIVGSVVSICRENIPVSETTTMREAIHALCMPPKYAEHDRGKPSRPLRF